MSNYTRQTKYAALITYVIVLVCMITSFFIPVFDGGVMLFRELPGAFGVAFGKDFTLDGFFVPFGLTSYYTVFNAKFNLAAWAVLLYSLVTILGIFALITVAFMQKTSRLAVDIVYISEILAVFTLLIFVYDRLTLIANGCLDAMGWILIAILGVIWLIYTIQSTIYKKGAGIAKSILFLLSFAGLCCLFLCETAYGGGWIYSVADALKASHYFIGDYSASYLVCYMGEMFTKSAAYGSAIITAIVVILNAMIDTVAIAIDSNKLSKTFNLVRYGIELILAIITAIIGAVKGVSPGIYLYVLMLVVLTQIVISTIRMFTRATFEEAIEYGGYDYDDEEEVPVQTAYEEPSPAAADGFYEAPDPTTMPPPIYTKNYEYTDDSFLNSLSPSERAEFYAIFIDKRRGNFYFLPEYEIGGENKEFFQSLFIYLGKIMDSISDGLMNKIYRRLNMLS